MIDFKNPYNREEVLEFLQNSFLKDFQKDITTVDIPEQKHIQKAHSLGYSKELGLRVFEFLHEGSTEKRVTLTKEAFNVLRQWNFQSYWDFLFKRNRRLEILLNDSYSCS